MISSSIPLSPSNHHGKSSFCLILFIVQFSLQIIIITTTTTLATIHESLKWKDSNPALVIPAVSALVLFINRNPRIFVRNFVLASAFVSAALYPKIFVQAFYKPKEFLENSFVSYEKRAEERKAAQQALQTTTAAPTTTTTTTATETAVEKPPKEDSVLSEEESNEATNTAPPTIVEENKA